MSAYDTPEQEISEGGDAVLSQPFLTESQRLALDAALAAKAATLTTEGGKEAHHDKATAGAHHLLHGKPGDRKSRMGKGSRATKGTGTKKGGAGGKFTWGDLLCESREGHGMEALDENDPNYDSDGREQSGTAAVEQPPRPRRRGLAAKIEAYKEEVMSILQEYFSSGDIDEAATSLQEMDLPMYDYYFVKRGLTMAMDRKDHDREMVSTILSALYGEVITPDQMQKGFAAVVESLDDLLLDVPNAVELMSLFVCRAVVDDILPPSFIARMPSPTGTPIAALKQKCELHLGARHCGERLLRCWGKGAGIVLAETKESITMSLKEYLVSGEAAEVAANLRALDVPFFHHELVKQAVETALEQPKQMAAVVLLLKELSSSLLISGLQMGKGFCRVAEQLDDLALDNPAAPERFKELVAIVASEGVVENAESLLLPGKAAEAVEEEDSRPSDELVTYKASLNTTLREYFDSAEAREVVRRLEGSEHPQYHHIFVKHAVRLAMDRRDQERELVSLVLVEVAQAPGCVLPEQIARGFTHLLMEVDDTVLDVPDAVQLEALFLGRAIVDEVLPPVFLTDVIRSLRADSLGLSVVRRAGSILSARHASERLLGCWRGGATSVVQLREKIKLALQEFLNTRDVQEIGRCLHELGYPYFRHEVVFQAMELAFGNENQMDQVAHLLCALSKYGDINQTQMLIGFNRTERCLPDLALDYPHAEAVFLRIKDQAVQDGWLIPPC